MQNVQCLRYKCRMNGDGGGGVLSISCENDLCYNIDTLFGIDKDV